jgi:hypothetical protein
VLPLNLDLINVIPANNTVQPPNHTIQVLFPEEPSYLMFSWDDGITNQTSPGEIPSTSGVHRLRVVYSDVLFNVAIRYFYWEVPDDENLQPFFPDSNSAQKYAKVYGGDGNFVIETQIDAGELKTMIPNNKNDLYSQNFTGLAKGNHLIIVRANSGDQIKEQKISFTISSSQIDVTNTTTSSGISTSQNITTVPLSDIYFFVFSLLVIKQISNQRKKLT